MLGHELSHVTQRHISRIMAKQSRQMPLLLAGMILGMIAAGKSRNGDAGQAVLMGSQAAFMQNQLSFSRDMEREADRIGFGVMTQAGFAPQGAAAMFEKLQYASRLNDNGSYPYLRSHPLNSERIADMQGRFQFRPGSGVTDAAGHGPRDDRRARPRARRGPGVDVLRLWVDAAGSGEFARSAPAQQAGTLYAAALSANELRDFKAARALAQRLVARTSEDAAGRAAGAPALGRDRARRRTTRRRQPRCSTRKAKDRPEMLLAAQAAVATRNPAPMVAPLRDWVAPHPRDATAWRMLADLYGAQNDTLRAVRADAEANVAVLDYPGARDRFKAAQELMRKARKAGGVPSTTTRRRSSTPARGRSRCWSRSRRPNRRSSRSAFREQAAQRGLDDQAEQRIDQRADQRRHEAVDVEARSSPEAAQNSRALITNRKRPSVTMVTGSVSTTSTGRTTMLSRPITAAAISAEVKFGTCTPL